VRSHELVALAPLHQPPALAALDIGARRCGCDARRVFDTAFHRDAAARRPTYAVPACGGATISVYRYGFHGLSHAYAARGAAELLGRGLGA